MEEYDLTRVQQIYWLVEDGKLLEAVNVLNQPKESWDKYINQKLEMLSQAQNRTVELACQIDQLNQEHAALFATIRSLEMKLRQIKDLC